MSHSDPETLPYGEFMDRLFQADDSAKLVRPSARVITNRGTFSTSGHSDTPVWIEIDGQKFRVSNFSFRADEDGSEPYFVIECPDH